MEDSISLNKFISDTGYCSRREADNLIKAGRVMLNDQVAVTGNRYAPGDVVEVDGSLITPDSKEKRVYLALNKPVGITSTTELQVKGNIITFVGHPKRIFPIGRLDKDSEGLIFLTNDGDIINKILRAGNSHEKEYIVRLNKPADAHFAQKMAGGLPIMGTTTLPCKVQMINRQTFKIILTQGLNRQIRRMCEYLGYTVKALQRVRIMNITLGSLALGKWRNLSEAEVKMLMDAVAESKTVTAKSDGSGKKKKHATTGTAENTNRHHQEKPASDNKKSGFRKEQHSSPRDKQKSGRQKFSSAGNKPKYGEKPAHDGKKSGFAKDKTSSVSNKPKYGEKPARGDNNTRFGKDASRSKPTFGKEYAAGSNNKPSFKNKPATPKSDKKTGSGKDNPPPSKHKSGFKEYRSKGNNKKGRSGR